MRERFASDKEAGMTAYVRPRVELLRGWLRGRGELVLRTRRCGRQLAMYERRRPDARDSDRLWDQKTPSALADGVVFGSRNARCS